MASKPPPQAQAAPFGDAVPLCEWQQQQRELENIRQRATHMRERAETAESALAAQAERVRALVKAADAMKPKDARHTYPDCDCVVCNYEAAALAAQGGRDG